MDLDKKIELIKSVGEEIVSEEELKELLMKKKNPIAYDGFEPSGQIHIAQGLLRTITVNKLTSTGIKFKFYVADWFGMLNNKYGGNLEKIKIVGEYFIEVWKACGLDMKNVEFIWTSDFVKKHPEYWKTVLKLSMNTTVNRVLRCGQIMGREESTNNPAAQILYPLMQAADIYHLGADIAQLGMDQRKVNMLARELFPKLGFKSPIVISHHMLMGLSEPKADKILKNINVFLEDEYIIDDETILRVTDKNPKKKFTKGMWEIIDPISSFGKKEIQNVVVNLEIIYQGKKYPLTIEETQAKALHEANLAIQFDQAEDNLSFNFTIRKDYSSIDRKIEIKMSKSKPNTAIFMTDTEEDIKRKFKKAYCPEGKIEDNPILEYVKYIVFEKFESFVISRPEKFGGDVEFDSYKKLENAYLKKEIHPMDLKDSCAKYINELLIPIREHFENDKNAKKLLEKVKSFQVSR